MGGIFVAADRRRDVVEDFVGDIVDQHARLYPARAQVVEGQVAGGLEHERFKVLDGPLAQGTGDPQVGFLQQVLGGAGVAYHALQGTQQGEALGEED
ncbi:hypothetical protein D9M71_657210 [compost metagenome]